MKQYLDVAQCKKLLEMGVDMYGTILVYKGIGKTGRDWTVFVPMYNTPEDRNNPRPNLIPTLTIGELIERISNIQLYYPKKPCIEREEYIDVLFEKYLNMVMQEKAEPKNFDINGTKLKKGDHVTFIKKISDNSILSVGTIENLGYESCEISSKHGKTYLLFDTPYNDILKLN